ncbi:hypothetical protein ACP70R_032415 [Stipagrostis hirtigluma subsp. patula]
MDTSHAVCKECVAEHYWHHMDDQKCFFKVMIGDFRNEVVIPKEFAMNIRGLISDEVKLEAPNGKTHDVKVVKEQNDLVIGSGWATFARAYDLNQGDFLVFTYSGHSHLKVRIFSSTGCEKELSCVPIDGIPCVQERHVSHGNHTQSPTSKRLAKLCIGSSSDRRKSSKTSPTGTPSRKTATDVPTSEGIQEPMSSGGFQESTKSCIVLPMGCSLTSEQKAKITTLEQKIQPKIPLYITAMDKASVAGGFLAIRKNYAVKHLSDNNGTITLSQLYSSKTWAINLDMSTDGLYALSSGWLNFIHDNMLQDGDICIFQLSKSKRDVTWIFHPLEESCPPEPPGYVGSIKSPRHRVMLPRFTTLNDQQKNKVYDTIRAIQSKIHIYVAIMQNSNTTRSTRSLPILVFGLEYATKYLPHGSQTMRLRRPGMDRVWEAQYRVRNRLHSLGQGWRQFVDGNKLKLGDICLFQLMQDKKKLTMTVHIIRKEQCR